MYEKPDFYCPICDDLVDDSDYFAGIWSFYCHECGNEYGLLPEDYGTDQDEPPEPT